MKTFKKEHPTCKCIPKQAVLTPDRYRALLAGSPVPPPHPILCYTEHVPVHSV